MSKTDFVLFLKLISVSAFRASREFFRIDKEMKINLIDSLGKIFVPLPFHTCTDTDLLTLLQLPLIEVGNAVRAYCYSIASYLYTLAH